MTRLAWLVSSRDLRWRWRRFMMALLGTTVAFTLALLFSAFREGIQLEATHTVRGMGAQGFLVRTGVHGPFTTLAEIDAGLASDVAALPGAGRADPIVTIRHTIRTDHDIDVYIIGAVPGGLGSPQVHSGRPPAAVGEAAIDRRSGRHVGDQFLLGGRTFRVVGLTTGDSVFAGIPDLYLTLSDAQDLIFGGRLSATAILTQGMPQHAPADLQVLDVAHARSDLLRPLANAIVAVQLFQTMIWLVAAAIIGSVLYISALERNRDFAVFKAFGTAGSDLAAALALQALALAVIAGGLAIVGSRLMEPLYPASISFPTRTAVLLLVIAGGVGLIGSLAGARRALVVDPATAFGGP